MKALFSECIDPGEGPYAEGPLEIGGGHTPLLLFLSCCTTLLATCSSPRGSRGGASLVTRYSLLVTTEGKGAEPPVHRRGRGPAEGSFEAPLFMPLFVWVPSLRFVAWGLSSRRFHGRFAPPPPED